MVDLGHRLRDLRKNHNLTQQQVADRVGISKAMVSSYELSARQPSYDILVKLAVLFGVSCDYLLGIEQACTINVTGLSDENIALVSQLCQALRSKD